MASLPTLPEELLDQILKDSAIARCELRSLRLTSRRLAHLSAPFLFSRICISRLWRDRNSFLAISVSPDLAKHVRTLVWYEYAAKLDSLRPLNDDDKTLYGDLLEQTKASFWLELMGEDGLGTRADQHDSHQVAIAAFLPTFLQALLRFPRLSALVSEPMCLRNPFYRIQPTTEGYPLTALKFYDRQQRRGECNLGAKLILPKAMEHLDASGTHIITTLRYTDEVCNGCFYGLSASLFGKYLTTVDLTFRHLDVYGQRRDSESVGKHLSELLAACHDLEYFRLNLMGSEMAGWLSVSGYLDILPVFPRLRELHLHGIPMDADMLGEYMTKHARTLRHVYVELPKDRGEGWDSSMLAERFPALQLDTFVIESEHYIDDDIPQTPTYDRPKPFRRRYTLDCPELTMDEYPDPPSLVWPRRKLPSGQIFRAPSPEACELGPGTIEDQEDDIMTDIASGFPVSPDDEDDRPLYAREHISHLRHHTSRSANEKNHPPEWFFAKHPGGALYYRRAQPVLETGWATEVWRFKHRNGEVAMGDEPLEFWSDWEGSEAGDMEEPTPYGKVFSHCFHDWDAGTGWEEEAARQRELVKGNLDPSADFVLREASEPTTLDESVPEPTWMDSYGSFWEPLCRWNAVRWYTKTTTGSKKAPDATYTDY